MARLRDAARGALLRGLDRRATDIEHVRARLTDARPGRDAGPRLRDRAAGARNTGTDAGPLPVLRSVAEVDPGDRLRIRVGDGAVTAAPATAATEPATDSAPKPARRTKKASTA